MSAGETGVVEDDADADADADDEVDDDEDDEVESYMTSIRSILRKWALGRPPSFFGFGQPCPMDE